MNLVSRGAKNYWGLASKRLNVQYHIFAIDTVLYICDKYIFLCGDVRCYFGDILDTIFKKEIERRGCDSPHIYGDSYYNPKGKLFHTSMAPYYNTKGITISFDLGTTCPDDELINKGYTSWKKDLDTIGVCITRAKVHDYKKYSSDIEFAAD